MIKRVINATSNSLKIKAEIRTVNGLTPITYTLIRGGIFEIEPIVNYINLEDLIKEGNLKILEGTLEEADSSDEEPEEIVEDVEVDEELPEDEIEEPEDSVEDEEIPIEDETPALEEIPEPVVTEKPVVGEKPDIFICPTCNAEYATERGLNKHIQTKHQSE